MICRIWRQNHVYCNPSSRIKEPDRRAHPTESKRRRRRRHGYLSRNEGRPSSLVWEVGGEIEAAGRWRRPRRRLFKPRLVGKSGEKWSTRSLSAFFSGGLFACYSGTSALNIVLLLGFYIQAPLLLQILLSGSLDLKHQNRYCYWSNWLIDWLMTKAHSVSFLAVCCPIQLLRSLSNNFVLPHYDCTGANSLVTKPVTTT